ncbi:hypothetical protein [Salinithrix halophila]|uniref:Regulatory protein YrvL n=1 Tax=Salinithrix halophila TaxID=1485204 RepID=A0ABV8JIA3_9BACL
MRWVKSIGIGDRLFALAGVTFLGIIIISIPVLALIGVFSVVEVVVPGIEVKSVWGMIWFGIGMLFYVFEGLSIGVVYEIFSEKIVNKKVKFISDFLLSLLLLVIHIYILDYIIDDIVLTFGAVLILSNVFAVAYTIFEKWGESKKEGN